MCTHTHTRNRAWHLSQGHVKGAREGGAQGTPHLQLAYALLVVLISDSMKHQSILLWIFAVQLADSSRVADTVRVLQRRALVGPAVLLLAPAAHAQRRPVQNGTQDGVQSGQKRCNQNC